MGGGSGVGMATNIVGSEMERWAAILAADAMNRQFNQQMRVQNNFRQQGIGGFNAYAPTLSAENATKTMGEAAQGREGAYSQVANRPLTQGDGADASVNAAVGLQGQQRSGVGAYGDWQTKQSIGSSQFDNLVNRIGYRAKGSAQVFPYQMSKAQHSMDWLQMLGEMIKGVGGASADFSNLNQQQVPTNAQYSAFNSGQGPVSASYAQSLQNPSSPSMYNYNQTGFGFGQ